MSKNHIRFIDLIKAHHLAPKIYSDKRHLGIILTLVGFLLYAFYTVLFKLESHRHTSTVMSTSIEFLIFYASMLISYSPFCIVKGKSYFRCENWGLVGWRGITSIICVFFYSLAGVWGEGVDNTIFYTTDAFWVVAIMLLFGMQVKRLSLIGALIGFSGVIFMYLIGVTSIRDLIGALFGIISGITLAIVIVMTRYIVQKDPPLRIGFYQACIGTLISALVAISLSFHQGWQMPAIDEVIMMILSGFLFSLTLFCFLEAFFYTEPYVIGGISLFLPTFVESINWVVNLNKINLTTIAGYITLIIGGIIVITASYKNGEESKINNVK